MRFVYSVVRFVPDPARGEFVNVGAIVGSEETSEWGCRQVGNPVRARKIDDRKVLDAVWSFFARVGRDIDEYETKPEKLVYDGPELSEGWLQQLFVDHRNIVQLSPPTPMIAATADEALDRVFDQAVVDPAQRSFRFQKKNTAIGAIRRAYREFGVRPGANLQEPVRLETEHHRERIDFAVTNGHVLQLTHAWSFQFPEQDLLAEQIKAWGWTIQDVRQHGGAVVLADGQTVEVTRDVDVEVVYVPPAPEQPAPAFRDAENVFDSLEVRRAAVPDAQQVARRARDLLVRAGERLV